MDLARRVQVTFDLNLVDPARLHELAAASYIADGGEDVEDHLGTARDPKVDNCLLELLGVGIGGGFLDAGFEVMNSEPRTFTVFLRGVCTAEVTVKAESLTEAVRLAIETSDPSTTWEVERIE